MMNPLQSPGDTQTHAEEPLPNTPAPRAGKHLAWLTLAAAAALLILLGWPLVVGRMYMSDDLKAMSLPMRYCYSHALAAGDSFLWSPQLFCGFYLQGDQAGMTHPLHWLLYRTLPLTEAFNIEFLFSYPWMFAGVFLMLRRWRFETYAALFGAMAFTFGGYNIMHFMHMGPVAIVSQIPWLIFVNDVVLCTADRKRLALAQMGVALLTASQILLVHPQHVGFSLMAEAVFIAWRFRDWAGWRRLPILLVAKTLGVAMAAVQILPTWDVLAASTHLAPALDYRLGVSLHPLNLVQLWSPLVFRDRFYGGVLLVDGNTQEMGIYAGAFCTVAAAWLWVRRRELGPRRGLVLTMVFFGLGALVLTLGKYGGVYTLLADLPLLKSLPLRASARFIVLVQLALAVLAAVALADLVRLVGLGQKIPWRRLWPLAVPAALAVFTAVVALWVRHGGADWSACIASDGYVLGGMAVVLAATCLVIATARGLRWGVHGIVALAFLEIAVLGMGMHVWSGPILSLKEVVGSVSAAPDHSGRIWDLTHPDSNILVMADYNLMGGYSSLVPRKTNMLDTTGLQLAGVHWVLLNDTWAAVPDPLPRARLVSHAVVANLDVAAAQRINVPIDVLTTAVVDQPVDLVPAEAGSARIVVDRPGLVEVQTSAPSRQLLVLSESYHRGWRHGGLRAGTRGPGLRRLYGVCGGGRGAASRVPL